MTAEQTEHEALTVGQARILLNRAWTCTCWPHTAMTARVPEVEAFLAGFHRSPTPRTVTTVEWGIEYDIDVDNTVTEFGMSERDAKEAERLSPTDTRAVFRHLADQTEREALGRVIADYQACGHCDGTCGACLGEADAILAALPSLGYRLIDPDDEALVATAAAAFQEAWDSGIQDFDPDHDDYDTYIQRCMRAALKAVQT